MTWGAITGAALYLLRYATFRGILIGAAAATLLLAGCAFPACEYEDSSNCMWNAETQGNGQGQSFIDIAGRAYHLGD